MISIYEALGKIDENTEILPPVQMDILGSLNMVLAEDIFSKDFLPPFDKSAMDGYVIKSQETDAACETTASMFKIEGIIKAGDSSDLVLQEGQAYKIMTGAPLPVGGDAVLKVEDAVIRDGMLNVYNPISKGKNVIRRGEEIVKNQLVLRKGKEIRPAEIGLLASLGYSKIHVYRSPVVTVLTTGDELLDIGVELTKGKIRNSNEYTLSALLKSCGAKVQIISNIIDDKEVIREKVKYALNNSDMLITTGGVSVGDFDFVEQVLHTIGAKVQFNSVAIKPGKPVTFATYGSKQIFALPGNPAAVVTTFEKLVKPAIYKCMGLKHKDEDILVEMVEDICERSGREKHIFVRISEKNGRYIASQSGSQSSNRLLTLTMSNGIVTIPGDCGRVKKGDVVRARFLL